MATATTSKPTESQSSFSAGLWARWKRARRASRARSLGHVRFRLTREGVHFLGILAFIFIGAVIREISLLILLAGAMIGLLLLQWRFNTSTLIGLTIRRFLPRTACVGKDAEIGIQFYNPKTWLSAWLVKSDDRIRKSKPFPQKTTVKGTALADTVRPRSTSSSRYHLQFHERGEYLIGPTILSTRFPLGIGIGWRTLDNRSKLIVHPRQGQLTLKAQHLFHLDQMGHTKSSKNSGSQEGEFYGLRPWASGDSRRWIHWRTTARLGHLSVRQFEQQQQNQATIILDLHDDGTEDSQQHQEAAISFVATLASSAIARGQDKIAIGIAATQNSAFPTVVSLVLVQQVLDDLAVAKASNKTDLLGVLRSLSAPLTANPQVLIVSTRGDCTEDLLADPDDDSMVRLLRLLRIRWLDVSSGELEPYFQWT